MKKMSVAAFILVVVSIAMTSAPDALAQSKWNAYLRGWEAVPAVSSPGSGTCTLEVNEAGTEVQYTLSYQDTLGVVSQSHIHLGQKGASGGVSVFLCSNRDNKPEGVPACPVSGEVSGTFSAANVGGPTGQGLAAGDLGALMLAISRRAAYVNVHTDVVGAGEIRGQLQRAN